MDQCALTTFRGTIAYWWRNALFLFIFLVPVRFVASTTLSSILLPYLPQHPFANCFKIFVHGLVFSSETSICLVQCTSIFQHPLSGHNPQTFLRHESSRFELIQNFLYSFLIFVLRFPSSQRTRTRFASFPTLTRWRSWLSWNLGSRFIPDIAVLGYRVAMASAQEVEMLRRQVTAQMIDMRQQSSSTAMNAAVSGKPEPYAPGKDFDDWYFTFNRLREYARSCPSCFADDSETITHSGDGDSTTRTAVCNFCSTYSPCSH